MPLGALFGLKPKAAPDIGGQSYAVAALVAARSCSARCISGAGLDPTMADHGARLADDLPAGDFCRPDGDAFAVTGCMLPPAPPAVGNAAAPETPAMFGAGKAPAETLRCAFGDAPLRLADDFDFRGRGPEDSQFGFARRSPGMAPGRVTGAEDGDPEGCDCACSADASTASSA